MTSRSLHLWEEEKSETFDQYNVNTLYEFTINLHDDYQYPTDDLRVMKAKKVLKDVMELNTWNYHLRTEISERKFGKRGNITRIHFHGIIKFKTVEQLNYYLTVQLNKLFAIGSVCVNAFREDVWIPYILKQSYLHPKENKQLANISLKHIMCPP